MNAESPKNTVIEINQLAQAGTVSSIPAHSEILIYHFFSP
jgi:hypothetical protein